METVEIVNSTSNTEDNINIFTDEIAKYVDKTLKDNYIKSLVQGGQIICKTILQFIDDGKDLNYIKSFCTRMQYKKTEKAFDNICNIGNNNE